MRRGLPLWYVVNRMRSFFIVAVWASIVAFAQEQPPAADVSASATRGMPARATPSDYQAHAQAGPLTIGAEFFQHTVPTPKGLLATEEYVVVEAGVFGPAGMKVTLNYRDFSLRVNSKKNPQPSEPYMNVFKSLKDPEWESPDAAAKGSKTSLNASGNGQGQSEAPKVVHPPFNLQREWNQRLEKEAFPEGERPLPQAGLLFFVYRGKASGIHSLELIYNGPAGKATFELQP